MVGKTAEMCLIPVKEYIMILLINPQKLFNDILGVNTNAALLIKGA
jgi:hypothetical protein